MHHRLAVDIVYGLPRGRDAEPAPALDRVLDFLPAFGDAERELRRERP